MVLWQQLGRYSNSKISLKLGENPQIGSGEVQIFKTLFMFKVTGSRSKVGSGSDYDVAQLDYGRNMCAKFELLPVYGYRV